jgi:hypothetical protein
MSGEDYCCEGCFEHPWLRATVRENPSLRGDCFYCGTRGWLAPVRTLGLGFRNLLSDYIPADGANGERDSFFPSESPLQAIQRDWKVFSARFMSKPSTCFLPAVFKGEQPPNHFAGFCEPVVPFHRNAMSTAYDKWLAFWVVDDRLLSEWDMPGVSSVGVFIDNAADHLRSFIQLIPSGRRFWRARAGYVGQSNWDCRPFPSGEMGSNPDYPASRLNRSGEAILYCAEDEKTAISEIRPGRGYICTTCELILVKEVEILDLATAPENINPFTCVNLSWRLDLRRIGRNLSARIGAYESGGG